MTVLMNDVAAELSPDDQHLLAIGGLDAVLYADDTLLMGVSGEALQRYLDTVARVGSRFGLELHWDKFQYIQVRSNIQLQKPDGERMEEKNSMLYLGATVSADGSIKTELAKRLGMAWSEFNKLAKLWKHASLHRTKKSEILQQAISTKLLIALSAAWLNVAELRRLDGFQSRCLRSILGIRPAYYSRVSNKEVLHQAGQQPYSRHLLKQQLVMFGRVGRLPNEDPLRKLTFCPNSLDAACNRYVRRVGRPRNEWASELAEAATQIVNNSRDLKTMIRNEA